jgi:hypothetical protein
MEKKMQLIRLSSGEEVIGKVTDNGDSITIKDGYSLLPAGEGRIGFMPFMAYTKASEGVTIAKQFIMFVVEPADEMVDQVRQMDTGIVANTTKKIVT